MEVSWRDYVDLRINEREKAHVTQIATAERNLQLAAETLHEKLAQMNQFRHQIEAERALYVKRDQIDTLLASRGIIVDQLVVRLEKLENWQSNVLGRQLVFGGAVVVVSVLINTVLRLVGH